MVNCFAHYFGKRARTIDLEILWPSIKAAAGDLESARSLFKAYVFKDSSWLMLSKEEIHEILESLA